MKPTDTTHTPDGILPTPGSYPLYEYPAYTFDRKYENDEFQKKVITLDSGYHLVLAPPGCGKTDILAERVVRALSCGVSLDDMLCLTFTNRAARGMRSRILERLQASGEMSLFVGNVHRFCSHYLFDNNVVARDTTVIDEQESLSIMASIFGWDEGSLDSNGYKRVLTNAIKLQHLGYMIASGCPKEFLMHTDLFRTFDYKTLFKLVSLDYTMENFAGLYNGTVFPKVDTSGQPSKYLDDCLQQFKFARKYQQYKEERNLVDFDDLLILTYIHASQHQDRLKKYSWIQIDEVQDRSQRLNGCVNAAVRTCTACISTTVPRNISWMSSIHTPTWSLMLTLISCLRRTILLKPDRIFSASCPLPKRTLKLGLWLKVLVISVPCILLKGWLFLCPGTRMLTRYPVYSPTAISPTSRFLEQTFSLPVRLSCFLPICRWCTWTPT